MSTSETGGTTPQIPVNPFEAAAAPSLISVLEAIQTFNTNMGTDPTKWAVNFPGALQVLLGTVELQGPSLAASEAGALMSAANTKISGWITALKAL